MNLPADDFHHVNSLSGFPDSSLYSEQFLQNPYQLDFQVSEIQPTLFNFDNITPAPSTDMDYGAAGFVTSPTSGRGHQCQLGKTHSTVGGDQHHSQNRRHVYDDKSISLYNDHNLTKHVGFADEIEEDDHNVQTSSESPTSDGLFVPSDEEDHHNEKHHSNNHSRYFNNQLAPYHHQASPTVPPTPNSPPRETIRSRLLTSNTRFGKGALPSLKQKLTNTPRSSASTFYTNSRPTTCHNARKRHPEEDPENHLIKKLRTKDHMSWGDIVVVLNRQRIAQGRDPSFTEAAVYGRFKRNGPLIAQAQGDVEFDPADFMYMKKKKKSMDGGSRTVYGSGVGRDGDGNGDGDRRGSIPGKMIFTAEDDAELEHVYDNELGGRIWGLVAERLEARIHKGFDAQACSDRMRHLRRKL